MLQSLLPPPLGFPMKLYEGGLLDTLLLSPSILAQSTTLTFSSLRQSYHLNEGKTVAMLTPSFMTRTFNCVHVNTFIQMRTVNVSPISLLRCFVDGSTTTMG